MARQTQLIVVALIGLAAARVEADSFVAQWIQRDATGPSPRELHALATAGPGQVLLFGGYGLGPVPFGDTWLWDGEKWTERKVSGPSPRYGHAMAFDSARRRVVLFGGASCGRAGQRACNDSSGWVGEFPRDTWEWDGQSWQQRATTGPPPRNGHAMAYDAQRGRVVLFGGLADGQTELSDTWEWDGNRWQQRAASGPSARGGHAMAYDEKRGRVVLFGGHLNKRPPCTFPCGEEFADLWEWDGASWAKREAAGPAPREQALMAWDPFMQVVLLTGGINLQADQQTHELTDSWAWTGDSWVKLVATAAIDREVAALASDGQQHLVLFGGFRFRAPTGLLADTWEFGPPRPPARRTIGGCDEERVVQLAPEAWRAELRRAKPDAFDAVLAKLKLPPLNRDYQSVKLDRVDLFPVRLSGSKEKDVVVQAKFIADFPGNGAAGLSTTARMYRIQVLTPLAQGRFCAVGSELSTDQLDQNTNAGPVDGMHDENAPMTFGFVQLTHADRMTIEVVRRSRTISRSNGVFTGHVFWDVADGKLADVLEATESDIHCPVCEDAVHQMAWFELLGTPPKIVRKHAGICSEPGPDGGVTCGDGGSAIWVFTDGGYAPR